MEMIYKKEQKRKAMQSWIISYKIKIKLEEEDLVKEKIKVS